MTKSLGSGRSEVGQVARPATADEVIDRLEKEIEMLRAALRGAEDRYRQLHEQYDKISDMWNAFQAAHNLEPRDIIRAEAVGEFARKLSMLLIRLGTAS
jgi:chromosome segregation ATPase